MKDIIAALNQLKENPDDLSALPQTIAALEEYSTNVTTREQEDLERITKLQESNRSLLSQIPIGDNKAPADEAEDNEPTFEQAQEQLLNAMNSVGGN